MKKKETIKQEYIIKDIANRIKSDNLMSKKAYTVLNYVLVAVSLLLIPLVKFSPMITLFGCIIILFGGMCYYLFICPLIIYLRIQHIDLDEYSIKELVLSDKKTEEYNVMMTRRPRRLRGMMYSKTIKHVVVNTLYFEKSLEWRIPDRLYYWREDGAFSGSYVYDNADKGDRFIAVINKKNGDIFVAYSAELFDYTC